MLVGQFLHLDTARIIPIGQIYCVNLAAIPLLPPSFDTVRQPVQRLALQKYTSLESFESLSYSHLQLGPLQVYLMGVLGRSEHGGRELYIAKSQAPYELLLALIS